MESTEEAATAAIETVTSKRNVEQRRKDTCQLCNVSQGRYTCPRCDIPYCSLACYKSESHFECCQGFYKDCVENELKLRERDPAARRRMMDILERTQARDILFRDNLYGESSESSESNDSDDEEDIPDLAERLESVDLDDADRVWSALSEAERQEFQATLRNGDARRSIPQWIPWWSETFDRKIIREIEDEKVQPEYREKCPKIINVAALDGSTISSPSVRSNLSNVLHAYAYTALHCNGDHHNSARESVEIFLGLSDNMLRNEIYRDSESAIEAVSKKILADRWLSADPEAAVAVVATEDAVNRIIAGPEKSNPTFYVLAALSDLHELLSKARKEFVAGRRVSGERTFVKKFSIGHVAPPKFTKKTLFLCIKKIEYYMSWVKKYGNGRAEAKENR